MVIRIPLFLAVLLAPTCCANGQISFPEAYYVPEGATPSLSCDADHNVSLQDVFGRLQVIPSDYEHDPLWTQSSNWLSTPFDRPERIPQEEITLVEATDLVMLISGLDHRNSRLKFMDVNYSRTGNLIELTVTRHDAPIETDWFAPISDYILPIGSLVAGEYQVALEFAQLGYCYNGLSPGTTVYSGQSTLIITAVPEPRGFPNGLLAMFIFSIVLKQYTGRYAI